MPKARTSALAGGRVDRALDTSPTGGRIDRADKDRADKASPAGGSLPTLIELTGDPDRVLTVSDFAAAAELGTRIVQIDMRYGRLSEFARLARRPLAMPGPAAGRSFMMQAGTSQLGVEFSNLRSEWPMTPCINGFRHHRPLSGRSRGSRDEQHRR